MVEGAIPIAPPRGGFKHPMQPGVPFNTTNVLLICGGAFVGLEDIIARRLGRGGLLFQLADNGQATGNRVLLSSGGWLSSHLSIRST
jgi:ATP-dependent Clp protease ATP-binding subunit ClpX